MARKSKGKDISTSKCSGCGNLLNAAYAPGEPKLNPRAGNLSVYAYCGVVLRFKADLSVVETVDPIELLGLFRQEPGFYKTVTQYRKAIESVRSKDLRD